MDANTKISSKKPQDIVSSAEQKKERKSLSYEEKIEELDKKMEQLKARKRDLVARRSKEDRKKRTKRLIQLGGIVEKVLKRPTTDDDLNRFEKFLTAQEKRGSYFSTAMNQGSSGSSSFHSPATASDS